MQTVEDYGGMGIEVAPVLGLDIPDSFELPLAPSLSLALVEVGLSSSLGRDMKQPGVDSWAVGVNVETMGVGTPGIGLEEGTLGSYLAVSVALPLGKPEDMRALAALESEIRQASWIWIVEDVAVATARYWWHSHDRQSEGVE